MNLKQLTVEIKRGAIDTVIVAFPDGFGRLIGKRFTGEFFLKSVAKHGTHGCNYLLTVNIEMDPLDGFQLANWEKGFGDFAWRPDFSTLRLVPWQPGAALILCDCTITTGARWMKRRGRSWADRSRGSRRKSWSATSPANLSFSYSTRATATLSPPTTASSRRRAITGSTTTRCSRRATRRSSGACATR